MGQASAPSALTSAHADPAASSSLAPPLPPSVPAPSSCCVSGVYSLASASSPPSRDGMASRCELPGAPPCLTNRAAACRQWGPTL